MKTTARVSKVTPSQIQVIEKLRRDFALFRQCNGTYRRIPQRLRQAVITALDDGICPADVKSACGVTAAQVALWRSQYRSEPPASCAPSSTPDVRVLNVVERPEEACEEKKQGVHFALRIGQWHININWG